MSAAMQEILDEKFETDLTPMIDVSFLILIFFMLLPFKTLEGKLETYLPTDKGIAPTDEEPPDQIEVQIEIKARDFEKRKWGPPTATQDIDMPTRVRYEFGDDKLEDLKSVYALIDKKLRDSLKTHEKKHIIGKIKAAYRIPHKFVIAVLNKFYMAGYEKVEFFGSAIPKEPIRKLAYLPYPTKDFY